MMDKELQQLQAPVRTDEGRQKSLQIIQSGIKQREKYRKKQYYSVLAAAIVLISILAASFFDGAPNKLATNIGTIEKGYIVQHHSTNLSHMMKWYYFQKKKISQKNLAIIEPYIQSLPTSTEKTESLSIWPEKQLLLKMSNGQIKQVAIFPYAEQQLMLIDAKTKQTIVLSVEESQSIKEKILANKSLSIYLKLIIVMFLLVLWLSLMKYFKRPTGSPMKERGTLFYGGLGVAAYFLWSVISGFSYYIFDTLNGLFIAIVGALLLLGKICVDYYNGKASYPVVSVIPFFFVMLLVTFIYCM